MAAFQALHLWVQLAIVAGVTLVGIQAMKGVVTALEIWAASKREEQKQRIHRDQFAGLAEDLKRRSKQ